MIVHLYAPLNESYTIVAPAQDGEWSSDYVSSPAGVDSEVSSGSGAFADCTNEWTEIGTSGVGTLLITAAERSADPTIVKISSSTEGVNFDLFVLSSVIPPVNVTKIEGVDATDQLTTYGGGSGSGGLTSEDVTDVLEAYGAAKTTDVSSAQSAIQADIAALENVSTGDISGALESYGAAKTTDVDSAESSIISSVESNLATIQTRSLIGL